MTAASSSNLPVAQRIEALDGVRGLAILLVIVMHCAMLDQLLPAMPPQGFERYLGPLAMLGWCGVDVFFVLSGFLITGILLRSKGEAHYFRNFYARRALRIFPLYYAVMGLLLFVLPRPPATAAEQVSYLLYYQNIAYVLVGEQHVDIARLVTWSLAIEEQFYLVWPAVVLLVSRRALVVVCAAMLASAFVLRLVLVAANVENAYFLTPCRLDALAAGALLALLPRPSPWWGRLLVLLGGGGLVAIAFASGSSLPQSPAMQRWGLLMAMLMAVGVLVLARGNGLFARLCGNRLLRSIGQYSYCMYLTHLLVIEACAYGIASEAFAGARAWLAVHCPFSAALVAFTVTCVAGTWLLACASWHLFEKHFLALKRYFVNTRPRVAG